MNRIPARRRGAAHPRATVWVALAFGLFSALWARHARAIDNVCGGQTHQDLCGSPSQHCICCNGAFGSGNCVWWAWEQACRQWHVALSYCRDAHYWDEDVATQDGLHVDPEPCAETIFICEQNTSQCGAGNWGHVGWVLEVYPDGSIRVSEQGCEWFDGTRERTFAAQNAIPAMHYAYAPGQTSCSLCECSPGETESRECPDGCSSESRTCGNDCRWGSWSGCGSTPECHGGETRSCGVCGTQICLFDCQWADCEDPCAGAADAAGLPDGNATGVDAGGEDAGPRPDASGDGSAGMRGGCHCRAAAVEAHEGLAGVLLAGIPYLLWIGWRRRRRAARGR